MRGGRGLLVVAKDGHVLVGGVVPRAEGVHVALLLALLGRHLHVRLGELRAERDRRVIRAEHFGGEAFHHTLEIVVQVVGLNLVEELLGRLLALHELFDHLVHDWLDWVGVVVDDRVLTQEVEMEHVLARVVLDMLDPQRAAAYRVRLLVRVLLIAHTQREPVDQVHGDALLLRRQIAVLHPLRIVFAHLADVLLEQPRLFVLGHVRHALPRRVGREPDALILAVDRVLPLGEPGDRVLVHHLAPFVHLAVSQIGHRRHLRRA